MGRFAPDEPDFAKSSSARPDPDTWGSSEVHPDPLRSGPVDKRDAATHLNCCCRDSARSTRTGLGPGPCVLSPLALATALDVRCPLRRPSSIPRLRSRSASRRERRRARAAQGRTFLGQSATVSVAVRTTPRDQPSPGAVRGRRGSRAPSPDRQWPSNETVNRRSGCARRRRCRRSAEGSRAPTSVRRRRRCRPRPPWRSVRRGCRNKPHRPRMRPRHRIRS